MTTKRAEIILHGQEAIDWAERHGATLSKYSDPLEAARDGLTVEEAREIAREDPGLIYVVVWVVDYVLGMRDSLTDISRLISL